VANPSADWRARALASFPELRDGLEVEDDIFSIYILLGELLDLLKVPIARATRTCFGASTSNASWAREQADDDSRNAADVSFYEHLFDERWMRPLVIPWINSAVVRDYMGLWEFRLSPTDLDEVRRLLHQARLLHLEDPKRSLAFELQYDTFRAIVLHGDGLEIRSRCAWNMSERE
jgi:hypothetical protein